MFKFNIFTISFFPTTPDLLLMMLNFSRNFFSFYLKLHEKKLFLCNELFSFKDTHTFPSNFPDPEKKRKKKKRNDLKNVDLLDKA